MTSKTLASLIWRLKILELFGPLFLKLREARWKEAFHTITDFALLHVVSRNSVQITVVIFSQCLQRNSSDKRAGCDP